MLRPDPTMNLAHYLPMERISYLSLWFD